MCMCACVCMHMHARVCAYVRARVCGDGVTVEAVVVWTHLQCVNSLMLQTKTNENGL